MTRRRNPGNAFVVYTDAMTMLFAWAMMIVCMLLISAHLVVQNSNSAPEKHVGEYLVTLTWDNNRDIDLDLWLRDPSKHVIYYGNREAQNISLDRDSRGFLSNGEMHTDNREVISIRAIIPGDYLVAVGYYSGNDPDMAIDATLRVIKINPEYTEIITEKVHLNFIKESKNVVAFHISENGSVSLLPLPLQDLIRSTATRGVQSGTDAP